LEDRFGDRKARLSCGHRSQTLAVPDGVGQVRAVSFGKLRLVIEQIELRGGAALEHVNDALRLRGKMREPRETACRTGIRALREQVDVKQFRQCSGTDTDTCLAEKTTPGQLDHNYSFITVWFRFRIKLVTLVYAASSVTSSLVSRGYSPELTYFKAASGLALN